MTLAQPQPGDEIAVDPNDAVPTAGRRIFHRPKDGNGLWRVLDNAEADLSQPKEFVVKGKQPNIYSTGHNWQVKVKDDDESTGSMRRGVVELEAWAY